MRPSLASHPLVVAGITTVVAGLVAWWLEGYFAGGCGSAGAAFSCLIEGLAMVFVGPFVVLLLGWLLLRALGVRHPFVAAVLAIALGAVLAYPAYVVDDVVRARLLDAPGDPVAVGVLAAVLAVAPATALAVWALSGAVTGRSVVVAAVTVVGVFLAAAVVENAEMRRRTIADLESAQVTLLAPPEGWVVDMVYVGADGSVHLTTHPAGAQAYGDSSVNLDLEPRPSESAST